jgi:hypothetical protein
MEALDMLASWLQEHATKFFIAFEVGRRAFNLLIQGIISMNNPTAPAHVTTLSKLLKKALPLNGGRLPTIAKAIGIFPKLCSHDRVLYESCWPLPLPSSYLQR